MAARLDIEQHQARALGGEGLGNGLVAALARGYGHCRRTAPYG